MSLSPNFQHYLSLLVIKQKNLIMAQSDTYFHDDTKSFLDRVFTDSEADSIWSTDPTQVSNILDSLDYDAFSEVFTRDVVHQSGLHIDNSLGAFIAVCPSSFNSYLHIADIRQTLKGQLQTMPPMTMKHVIERIGMCFGPLRDGYWYEDTDITSKNIIYASGYTTITFTSHPGEPVITPVLGVYTRVPKGVSDAGKISRLTIYEDHAPVMMKLKAILES